MPLDHSRPHGRTIELALVRARASDPATRIGSVFSHPGGPGVSGVDKVDQERAGLLAQPFTRPETLDVSALVERTEKYVRRCMALNGDLMVRNGPPTPGQLTTPSAS